MKKELDNLWYSYLNESKSNKSEIEKNLIKQILIDSTALRETLTTQQKELFEQYEQSSSALNSMTEKSAFIKGVKFTVRFLFEAICEN